MTGQSRQSVFGGLGRADEASDADRRGRDPAMRRIVGGGAIERRAASTSQMGRIETEPPPTGWSPEKYVYSSACHVGTLAMDKKVIW